MKRDRDYMRDLMLEMQNSRTGFVHHVLILNPSEEDLRRDHHLDLLMDEGLVARKDKGAYRLTPIGHDAVEAIEKSETWEKIKSLAPGEAYEVIKGTTSSLALAALSKLFGFG
ncbi:hypothetical protein [Pseudooceanicola sp. LIPI14-2-Ac024]|uniref:hypothetical protein n=1 Tax=Pseudooceanicola sp. LIPI14-2-Ac024 TaxID=3344875 RepID=UPI0035CEB6B4